MQAWTKTLGLWEVEAPRISKPGVLNLLEVAGQFENLVHVAGHTIDKSYIPLLGSNSEATPKGNLLSKNT
jgi:hypothetical protein